MVSLSQSEVGNLAMEMFSVVSARSQCSTKVARSPVAGLRTYETIMELCVLDDLFASESTISDSSNC